MKRADIVIGANYGDEGKGTVVASLTKTSTNVLNILTNGGAQRGHSILTKDGSMTFQHFGSGTYHGADSFYSIWYILNPIQFVKEYNELIVKPKHIYRDRRCRWSTPYDMMINLIGEEARTRKASCGMGIWRTIQRCDHMPIMLFSNFIANPDKQTEYLNLVKAYYEQKYNIPNHWKSEWNSEYLVSHFLEDCKTMADLTEEKDLTTLDYDHLIFENGQGLLLCDTGHDSYETTPSNTGKQYAARMIHEMGIKDVTAHYVTRPYLTRHGDGHLDDICKRKELSKEVLEDRTNRFNEHQGEFRYGKLDIPKLKERVTADAGDSKIVLEVTHCDEMDRIKEFKKEFEDIHVYDTPLI